MSDLTIERGDDSVIISAGDTAIAEYRTAADIDAVNTPKPHFHPLRTLAGTTITGFGPDDHPWHHGLQFAFPRVGDHNLWGGNTYLGPADGYQMLSDQGSIRHDSWRGVDVAATAFSEDLSWLGHTGETLLTEYRTVDVALTDAAGTPGWVLEFDSTLTNETDRALGLETPAQRGRPDGGYGGLFLRLGEDLQADRLVGDDADLAQSGDESRTLVIQGHTPAAERFTLGLSFLPHASPGAQKWLYRFAPEPFSAVGWAGAYDDGYELPAGGSISFAYRLAIFDGTVDPDSVRDLL